MSSWSSKSTTLAMLSTDKYFCKTSTSGYCSNFFNFFMCYLFAKNRQKKLYLHDTKNNISKEYHLILDTFQNTPTVEYTILNGNTLQQLYPKDLVEYYENLPIDFLQKEAQVVFKLNTQTQKQVDTLKKNLPFFHCGIHVRTGDKITTGEMKAIPFERYLSALKTHRKIINEGVFSIYLMTDSKEVIKYFQTKKDSDWNITTLPSPSLFSNGHDQIAYNKQSKETIKKCFYHFLAEIQILQQCPSILCTFSSNIGRFLKLTCQGSIDSLD